MKLNRRNFLKTSAAGALGSAAFVSPFTSCASEKNEVSFQHLDKSHSEPVLKKDLFNSPVIIESIELLRRNNNFLCRVRSTDGAEGISVSNDFQMIYLHPIFMLRVKPFFLGKDARNWDDLLDEFYVFKSNYKLQSLALWVPLATLEFAVLDMLGKIANKPIGELIGEIHNPQIAVYQANNFRGRSAEESIDLIRKNVEKHNARAVKFKVGGRMSTPEKPEGRSEKLIPLVRETFGDGMTIYADSNGSYNVDEAVSIGQIMQEHNLDFYEEPVPFDWYEETKAVADNLQIPVAGGEQESSMHAFRWLIGNDALQIVQPDIFYFGGMIRSMQVSRMAASKGLPCVPHISGSGLGFLYMMHFVSALPNAGPFHEFKGFNESIPMESPTSDLTSKNGYVQVPTAPGLGVIIDPDYISKFSVVKES